MSQSFTSMDARTQPRIIPCTNGIGLYEIDETHETFDTLEEAQEALTKLMDVPEYIEGKDYTWIYDHDGNWVRYWHASHRIDRDVPRYPEPEGCPSY